MNNTEIKIHYYQKSILKKLTLNPIQRFNDLLIEGLESEHMNYHLKQLIEFGLVGKDGSRYQLTDLGKDYCNLLDDNVEIVEKQPKTSIIIWGVRKNGKTGEIEHLLNKRLRQPYFGKLGRITGKVRFGETLQQAAARELFEESGLTAKSFILDKIYHKLRHREDGSYVQDVIFYIFFVADFAGNLIGKSEFQENFWMSKQELQKRMKDFDLYDDFTIDERVVPNPKPIFTETDEIAQGY